MMCCMQDWKRGTIAATFGLLVGYLLFGARDASLPMSNLASAQVASGDSIVWEYSSISIDAASLQTKLISMGVDGWDVFSIVSTDGLVDTGADAKPHLVTQRFEVTGKRKRR